MTNTRRTGRPLLLAAAAVLATTATAKSQAAQAPGRAAPAKSGQVLANGVNYYYEVHGTGEPLLLLHGGLGSIDMFEPDLPALAKERQVIAVAGDGGFLMTGQELATVYQVDPWELEFYLSERHLGQVRRGQEIAVTIAAYPDRPFRGRVDFVAPAVREATRDFLVKATIPNPDGLLKPGAFATALVTVNVREARPVVPEEALVATRLGYLVFTVEGGIARAREVRIGLRQDGMVEIREGLQVGDRVVQPELAKLLRAVAEHGPQVFYRGEVAEAIERQMKARGGLITRADLAAYQVKEREPLRAGYRGFELILMPPPSSGGVCIAETLNVLERFDRLHHHRDHRRLVEGLHRLHGGHRPVLEMRQRAAERPVACGREAGGGDHALRLRGRAHVRHDDAERSTLKKLSEKKGILHRRASPDGKHLLTVRTTGPEGAPSHISVARAGALQQVHRIVSEPHLIQSVIWSADSREIFYTVLLDQKGLLGERQLIAIKRAPRTGNDPVRQIARFYTEVIRGVDLMIEGGEFVVFVGPSGCGKSTLLRAISGVSIATPTNVSATPTPTNCNAFDGRPNSPYRSGTTPSASTTAPETIRNRSERPGRSCASRRASIGATRAARRAGTIAAISVTSVPITIATMKVRGRITVPDAGISNPVAFNADFSRIAIPTPTSTPMIDDRMPITTASTRTEVVT